MRETSSFPFIEKQVHRCNLERDKPLKMSPQRLSKFLDSEISIDSEQHPSQYGRINPYLEIINTLPSNDNRIDSGLTLERNLTFLAPTVLSKISEQLVLQLLETIRPDLDCAQFLQGKLTLTS